MTSPGPRGWQGQPNSLVRTHRVPAYSDVLIQCTFLNSSKVPTEPTSISWRMDSLTSVQNVQASTSVVPTGSQQVIQVPAAIMIPTRSWYGTEMMQVWIQAVITDTNAPSGSITVNKIVALEMVMESIPPGS